MRTILLWRYATPPLACGFFPPIAITGRALHPIHFANPLLLSPVLANIILLWQHISNRSHRSEQSVRGRQMTKRKPRFSGARPDLKGALENEDLSLEELQALKLQAEEHKSRAYQNLCEADRRMEECKARLDEADRLIETIEQLKAHVRAGH
jgi:hypothetical protein